jgi:hypothetical protein
VCIFVVEKRSEVVNPWGSSLKSRAAPPIWLRPLEALEAAAEVSPKDTEICLHGMAIEVVTLVIARLLSRFRQRV